MASSLNMKSAAGTNATLLASSACRVRGWDLNNGNVTKYVVVKLYDLARLPIPGVDIPQTKIVVPPAAANQIPQNICNFSAGVPFQNGLAYTITAHATLATVLGDLDVSAAGVDDLNGTLEFKLRP